MLILDDLEGELQLTANDYDDALGLVPQTSAERPIRGSVKLYLAHQIWNRLKAPYKVEYPADFWAGGFKAAARRHSQLADTTRWGGRFVSDLRQPLQPGDWRPRGSDIEGVKRHVLRAPFEPQRPSIASTMDYGNMFFPEIRAHLRAKKAHQQALADYEQATQKFRSEEATVERILSQESLRYGQVLSVFQTNLEDRKVAALESWGAMVAAVSMGYPVTGVALSNDRRDLALWVRGRFNSMTAPEVFAVGCSLFSARFNEDVRTLHLYAIDRGPSPVNGMLYWLPGGRITVDRDAVDQVEPKRFSPWAWFKAIGGKTLADGISLDLPGSKELFSDQPKMDLLEMDPYDFEKLIADLLRSRGYEVEVTKRSSDGGVDVVAVDDAPFGAGLLVVQAKRYSGSVPVAAIRELYGTVLDRGASKGILITTGTFSVAGRQFAVGKPIELIDGFQLRPMIDDLLTGQ